MTIGLAAIALLSSAARAAPGSDPRAELRERCDELLRCAVVSGFGWGWIDGFEAAEAANPWAANRHQPIDTRQTAAVGLELLLAGQLLDEPKYTKAAVEAARAVVAVQTRLGQFRARGVMGAFTGKRDDVQEMPHRGPTRAALGLLLSVIDATAKNGKRDARFTGPAAHGAFWLGRQQIPSGAFPILYPPDAGFGRGLRIILLHDADYRDSALTLLLAGEVLDDNAMRVVARRPVDQLLKMRVLGPPPSGGALWAGAHDLGGEATRRFPELPRGTDMVASRYCLEVMLAAYLLKLDPQADAAYSAGWKAMSLLPRYEAPGGRVWHRNYDRKSQPIWDLPEEPTTAPTTGPATRPTTPLSTRPAGEEAVDADTPPADAVGLFEIDLLIELGQRIEKEGGPKFERALPTRLSTRQRIAVILCGLSPDALLRPVATRPLPEKRTGKESKRDGQILDLWRVLDRVANEKSQ